MDGCLERRCHYCTLERKGNEDDNKNKILVTRDNLDEVIYYDRLYYHSNCFNLMCNKEIKRATKSIKSNKDEVKNGGEKRLKKWTNALRNIEGIKKKSHERIELDLKKDDVYTFICKHYVTENVGVPIWNKLDAIYSGTFKGVITPIPPEDLLDMWERRWSLLCKYSANKSFKNKDQRISYDLSVLVGFYDSYVKWKERQKILAIQEREENDNIVTKNVVTTIPKKVEEKREDDISGLVDDIFG